MPRAPTVRQADVDRAIRALKAQGYGVARLEIEPGGKVTITPGGLTDAPPQTIPDELEAYRERRAARGGRAT